MTVSSLCVAHQACFMTCCDASYSPPAQFEVVSKEEQAQGIAMLETRPSRGFLQTSRPPRPAVRLTSQPYQPKPRKARLQLQGAASAGGGQGRDQQPPIPWAAADQASSSSPAVADRGHVADANRGRALQPGSQSKVQQQQQVSPSRALEAYAEQMSADLGGGLPLSPIISQQIPEWVTEAATAAAHAATAEDRYRLPNLAQQPPASSSSHVTPHQMRGNAGGLPGLPPMLPRPQHQQHITVTNPLSSLPVAAPDRDHAAARPASSSVPAASGRQASVKPEQLPAIHHLHANNPLFQGTCIGSPTSTCYACVLPCCV